MSLNSFGALQVRRSWHGWLMVGVLRLRAALHVTPLPRLAYRQPATAGRVFALAARSVAPVAGLVALVAGAAFVGGAQSARVFSQAAVLVVMLWASIVAHESAHMLWVERHQLEAAFVRRGLRFGLLHKPLESRAEMASAVAGPLAGGVTALGLCAVVNQLFAQPLYWAVGGTLAALHLGSLLPLYGDGAALKRGLAR